MKKSLRTLCATASLCVTFGASGADVVDGKVLEVNGAFAAHLLAAKGGYPELDLSAGSANRSGRVDSVPLQVSFSNRISSALAAWLVTPTTAPPAAVAVLRVVGGRETDRLVLANPGFNALEIVKLGAQPQPIEFRVEIQSNSVSVLGGTAKPPTPVIAPEPYTVRLVVDGKPVLPLEVRGIGMVNNQGATGDTRARKPGEACNDFEVAFHQVDIGWLFEWYKGVVLTQAGKGLSVRRVDIELVSAAGKAKQVSAPLASLEGVVIKSFDPLSDPAGVAVTAKFDCDRFTLLPDAFK